MGIIEEKKDVRETVLYARVSTKKQEEYLKNQVKRLEEYANSNNWNCEIIQEISSGVNENRRGLQKLLNMVQRGEVERVVVEYPDRLPRFGFNYLKQFFSAFGVDLVVINGNNEEKEKMVELAERFDGNSNFICCKNIRTKRF